MWTDSDEKAKVRREEKEKQAKVNLSGVAGFIRIKILVVMVVFSVK